MKLAIAIFFYLLFVPFFAYTQTVEYTKDGRKMVVEDYLQASETKKNEGDYKEASRFMNGAAIWHWERKEYEKAISYFEQSIKLNETIDNEQAIIGIKNNLGMIYADLRQYDKAYTNFALVLEVRKKTKEPVSIIASLINISVITNNLKQYDKSIIYLNEALLLALQMGDTEQMRSCYGMLAETYEKQGDAKNMLKYFELYKTFHEQTQRDKISKVQVTAEEAKLRAKLLEMENRMKDGTILQKDTLIAEKQRELQGLSVAQQKLIQTMSKREMLLKIAQHEIEIQDLQINEQKVTNELEDVRQTKIRDGLIIGLLFLVLIAIILWYKNNEKQKINRILESQKTKLISLTEELSAQAEELSAQTEEIQLKNNKLIETNSVKDKVLSIIAHDVRSPLTVIGSFLELWETGDFDAKETVELVSQIKTSTFNTIEMLDNLLTWAKSQMRGISAKPANFMLAKIVANKIELLDELAKPKRITLINNITANTNIYADANQISIVLHNLIGNAIKFTPENGVITIDNVVSEKFTEVRVGDTGIGISEENIKRLFAVESHFTTTGTANEKGTGLGLLLCKEFIENTGGTISVKSVYGKGAIFSFTVPKNVL